MDFNKPRLAAALSITMLLGASTVARAEDPSPQPNLVLILADNLGYGFAPLR